MKRISFSIPFSVDLTREKAWEKLNKKESSFGIVRCHFQLREVILNEEHKVGEALAVYKSPKGVGSQHVISTSFELEKVNQKRTIEEFLKEHESTAELAAQIASESEFMEYKISAQLKSKVTEKLKDRLSGSQEEFESKVIKEKVSFEITNTIDPDITQPIVAVPAFKRKAYDLILGHVDYLRVDYVRSSMGLRKKAVKKPKIIDFKKHPNRLEFGIPVARIFYWDFMPKSSVLMLEKEHVVEVENSEQVSVEKPSCQRKMFVEFPDVPTLYQIANATFPLKWILRKPESKEWTEEQLKAIEIKEVKESPKKGWWATYGSRS